MEDKKINYKNLDHITKSLHLLKRRGVKGKGPLYTVIVLNSPSLRWSKKLISNPYDDNL